MSVRQLTGLYIEGLKLGTWEKFTRTQLLSDNDTPRGDQASIFGKLRSAVLTGRDIVPWP